jgi:hypothetical protein
MLRTLQTITEMTRALLPGSAPRRMPLIGMATDDSRVMKIHSAISLAYWPTEQRAAVLDRLEDENGCAGYLLL